MLPDTLTRDEYRVQQVAADKGLRRETHHDLLGPSGDAVFSADDRYRYLLTRRWACGGKAVTWIMLNPSTATASANDNTITRCMDFARRWGYSAMYVVNLFAYRATDPRELTRVADPVGPANDDYITDLCSDSWLTVAAWGVHGRLNDRARHVAKLLDSEGVQLSCLGVTSHGHPRHPLYLRSTTTPQTYQPKEN